MADTDDRVDLTDLDVIARYSLAVRTASVARDELIATLRSDLDWLEGLRRRPAAPRPAPVVEQPPAERPATPAPVRRTTKPATRTATKRATKTATRTASTSTARRAAPAKKAANKAAKKTTRRR